MAAFVPIADGQLSNSSALRQLNSLLTGALNADVSLAGALTVGGALTLSAGALNVTGAAITVGATGITSASPLLLAGTGSVKIVGGKLYPATDAGAAQTAAGLTAGPAPTNGNGANGDVHVRSDGNGTTIPTFAQRRAGAWSADLCVGSLAATGNVALTARFQPATPALAVQPASLFISAGVPSDTDGSDGDFALSKDGTAAGKTCLYHKEAGVWAAVVL